MEEFLSKIEKIIKEDKKISLFGLGLGEKGFLLSQLYSKGLLVSYDIENLKILKKQLEALNKRVYIIRDKLPLLFSINERGNNLYKEYCKVISNIVTNNYDYVLVSPEVLTQKFPNKDYFKKCLIKVKKCEKIEISNIVNSLILLGYRRQDMVYQAGEFSTRGDILDIFIDDNKAIRINFFDDEIERINYFNPITFLTIEEVDEVDIFPFSLCGFDESEKQSILERISIDYKKSFLKTKNELRLSEIYEGQIQAINNNLPYSETFFLPYNTNFNSSLLEYFEEEIIYFDEPKMIVDFLENEYNKQDLYFQDMLTKGEVLVEHKNFYVNKKDVFKGLENVCSVAFSRIGVKNKIFDNQNNILVLHYHLHQK